MKLYRVYSYDFGNASRTSTGIKIRAFTSKAKAEKSYNRRKQELVESKVRFDLRLDRLYMPDPMTAFDWINWLEQDYVNYKIENLRTEKFGTDPVSGEIRPVVPF